eukprot:ANDGO_00423.mRNA.1 hypothetical protein
MRMDRVVFFTLLLVFAVLRGLHVSHGAPSLGIDWTAQICLLAPRSQCMSFNSTRIEPDSTTNSVWIFGPATNSNSLIHTGTDTDADPGTSSAVRIDLSGSVYSAHATAAPAPITPRMSTTVTVPGSGYIFAWSNDDNGVLYRINTLLQRASAAPFSLQSVFSSDGNRVTSLCWHPAVPDVVYVVGSSSASVVVNVDSFSLNATTTRLHGHGCTVSAGTGGQGDPLPAWIATFNGATVQFYNPFADSVVGSYVFQGSTSVLALSTYGIAVSTINDNGGKVYLRKTESFVFTEVDSLLPGPLVHVCVPPDSSAIWGVSGGTLSSLSLGTVPQKKWVSYDVGAVSYLRCGPRADTVYALDSNGTAFSFGIYGRPASWDSLTGFKMTSYSTSSAAFTCDSCGTGLGLQLRLVNLDDPLQRIVQYYDVLTIQGLHSYARYSAWVAFGSSAVSSPVVFGTAEPLSAPTGLFVDAFPSSVGEEMWDFLVTWDAVKPQGEGQMMQTAAGYVVTVTDVAPGFSWTVSTVGDESLVWLRGSDFKGDMQSYTVQVAAVSREFMNTGSVSNAVTFSASDPQHRHSKNDKNLDDDADAGASIAVIVAVCLGVAVVLVATVAGAVALRKRRVQRQQNFVRLQAVDHLPLGGM